MEEAGTKDEVGRWLKERIISRQHVPITRSKQRSIPRYLAGIESQSMGYYWTESMGILLKVRGKHAANRTLH